MYEVPHSKQQSRKYNPIKNEINRNTQNNSLEDVAG